MISSAVFPLKSTIPVKPSPGPPNLPFLPILNLSSSLSIIQVFRSTQVIFWPQTSATLSGLSPSIKATSKTSMDASVHPLRNSEICFVLKYELYFDMESLSMSSTINSFGTSDNTYRPFLPEPVALRSKLYPLERHSLTRSVTARKLFFWASTSNRRYGVSTILPK